MGSGVHYSRGGGSADTGASGVFVARPDSFTAGHIAGYNGATYKLLDAGAATDAETADTLAKRNGDGDISFRILNVKNGAAYGAISFSGITSYNGTDISSWSVNATVMNYLLGASGAAGYAVYAPNSYLGTERALQIWPALAGGSVKLSVMDGVTETSSIADTAGSWVFTVGAGKLFNFVTGIIQGDGSLLKLVNYAGIPAGRYLYPYCAFQYVDDKVAEADKVYYTLFYVPPGMTIAKIGLWVQTGAAGNVKLALYTNSGGAPGALIGNSGNVDTSAQGAKEWTCNLSGKGGFYWVACHFSGTPTVTRVQAGDSYYQSQSCPGRPANSNRWEAYQSQLFTNGFPDPATVAYGNASTNTLAPYMIAG